MRRGRLWVWCAALAAIALSACSSVPVPLGGIGKPTTVTTSRADVGWSPAPAGQAGHAGPAAAPAAVPAWLRAELARRDGLVWALDLKPSRTSALGYVDQPEARVGTPVAVHLWAKNQTAVMVSALRIGDYGGARARVVWTSRQVIAGPQPSTAAAQGHTAQAAWPTSLVITPAASWPPGLYALRISPVTGGPPSYIPLYLAQSGAKSPRVVIGSTLTQLAYNGWGGVSLYAGRGGKGISKAQRVADRAVIASPHRPLTGPGMDQFAAMDVPLARFLDRVGLPADWTTDTAVDADPSLIRGYDTVVLPGHSEYWTVPMRDGLEEAVRTGTNLAVLGSNEIHWHARLVRDARGELSQMVMYRLAKLDPVSTPADKTVQWRDPLIGRDPATLTGLTTTAVGIKASPTVLAAPDWAFAGSGLKVGSVVANAYGNEGGGPSAASPHGLQVWLRATTPNQYGIDVEVATTYYTAASGAGVFNAGTTEWLCLMEQACWWDKAPQATRQALQHITFNVLTAFADSRAGQRLHLG